MVSDDLIQNNETCQLADMLEWNKDVSQSKLSNLDKENRISRADPCPSLDTSWRAFTKPSCQRDTTAIDQRHFIGSRLSLLPTNEFL